MQLREIFKKQGGFKLIKQYLKGGAILTAFFEFLILGRDRKGLELLRLTAQYKIKKNLEKKYKKEIQYFQLNYIDNKQHNKSNKVWVCWFQGLENAPDLVKKCYESLKKNLTDREIILITRENMFDFVAFPEFILRKWEDGTITHTHMTDLLRLELLIKYGGMWIDSTVLCTSNRENIPDYFFNSDLFLYQTLKPGRDGQCQPVSSWLISATMNNKILIMTRFLCYEYWKRNHEMVDYFLFHDFLVISLEHNIIEWKRIIPRENSSPHMLLLRLFDKFDADLWDAIKDQTPFHKLTYKFPDDVLKRDDTFYSKIITQQN